MNKQTKAMGLNSTPLERRIARVTWNTVGWVKPSGSKGKSKDKNSHEYGQGFGHEEWLFDTAKLINGYHYAFLEPIRGRHSAYEGREFDVMLYSIDGETRKRHWIGEIKKVKVLSHLEAKKAEDTYKANGWYSEMENQIEDAGGQSNSLSKWKDVNLFNICFKPQDLDTYSDFIEISPNEQSIKTARYIFIKVKDNFKQPVEVRGFSYMPPSANPNSTGNGYRTGYIRHAKPVEIELFHKKISDRLCERLQQEYGRENVHPEHPSGIGNNKIDIVVKDDDGHIFYEIKTHNALRVCIREALGQILEYAYYPTASNAKELIIVSQNPVDSDTEQYMRHLRANSNLPVYYRHFNLDTDTLSTNI